MWCGDLDSPDDEDEVIEQRGVRHRRMVYLRSTWAQRKQPEDVRDIALDDLINPHNRFILMNYPEENFIEWLGFNGLLATDMVCSYKTCGKECRVNTRESSIDGYSWRCRPGGRHEHSIRKYSFFAHSHLL